MTSLGVLFNFTSHAANTTVQFVADMVKDSWVGIIRLVGAFLTLAQFAEAIAEEPGVFLLVGCVFSSVFDICQCNLLDICQWPMITVSSDENNTFGSKF